MKTYLELAKYQIRKKSNILSVIIITIALSFVFIIATYKESVNNRLLNDVNEYIYYRSFMVGSEGYNEEELMNTLYNIDHVIDVYYTNYFQAYVDINDFKTEEFNGGIELLAVGNRALPEIVEGTNFPDDDGYYLICPEDFYPTTAEENIEGLALKDRFDIKSYLNKNVYMSYTGDAYNSSNPDKYKYDMNLKVIGLYKNSIYRPDINVCYTNKKVLTEYWDNVLTDITDYERFSDSIRVTINSAKNVDTVLKEMEDLGLIVREMAFIDTSYLDNVNLITTTIINFITILVFILIFLMLEKDFKESKKYYRLMAYLGFHKSDIRKTYITSSIIKLLFCISLAIILTIIAFIIFHIILYYRPFILGKMRLVYSFRSVLIMVGVLLLALLINVLANYKSVDFK